MRGSANIEAVTFPPEVTAFIYRRLGPLVRQDRAIIDLMGDAYVQGLSDAVNHLPQERPAHG